MAVFIIEFIFCLVMLYFLYRFLYVKFINLNIETKLENYKHLDEQYNMVTKDLTKNLVKNSEKKQKVVSDFLNNKE